MHAANFSFYKNVWVRERKRAELKRMQLSVRLSANMFKGECACTYYVEFARSCGGALFGGRKFWRGCELLNLFYSDVIACAVWIYVLRNEKLDRSYISTARVILFFFFYQFCWRDWMRAQIFINAFESR